MPDPWCETLPSTPMTPIYLQLLHAPMLAPQAGPAQPLQRKDAALLAMLALQGPTPRSQLTGLLWPDASDTGAINNLRQRLFRLRRAAGCELVLQGDTLRMAADVSHDLQSVSEVLRHDPQAARGDLLGSLDYGSSGGLAAWVATQRHRWRATLQATMLDLALACERRGELAEALPYARRLTQECPADELHAQLLMRLLYASSDRDGALAEFERCAQVLRVQCNRAPSDDTLALARLVGRSVPALYAAPTPLSMALRHPPRTVGRDAVFQAAERLWQSDHVVLLTGAAGIGKTRVLNELAQRWPVAIRLQAMPDDLNQPHGLLRRLVAALLPHLGNSVAAPDTAWLRWIAGQPDQPRPAGPLLLQPLVALLHTALGAAAAQGIQGIAIDDLHFACPGSLEALCAVLPAARSLPIPAATVGQPLRWLLAARDAPLPGPVRAWLAGIDGRFDPVVPVLPLAQPHIAELLGTLSPSGLDLPAWGQRLEQHCSGHPMLLLQVLRALQHAEPSLPTRPPSRLPLPDETLTMFARRLAQADEATQRLACVAAVGGADFSAQMAAQLLHCQAADLLRPWRQLQEMNILHGQGLSHELVREAVLHTVPASVAELMHLDVARLLQHTPDCSGRRACHWEAGQAWAQSAADYTDAADDALARGLPTQAITLLRNAARNHRRADAHADAAHCDWRAAHLVLASVSAAEAVDAARALLDAATGPAQTVHALEILARAKAEQHDSSALGDAEAAHGIAATCDDPALLALASLCLARAWMLVGRHAEALAALQALQRQPVLLAPQQWAEHADMLSVTLSHLGHRQESVDVSRRALGDALRRSDLAAAAGCAGNIAVQLGYLGQIEASIAQYRQAIDLGHRAGIERGYVLIDEMGLAGNLADQGRFADALGLFERVVCGLREAGYVAWAINAENDWAMTWLRLGRADLAQRLLADPPEDTPAWSRAARRLAQARLLQWRGGRALAAVQEAAQLLGQGVAIGDAYVRERIALELARSTSAEAAAAQVPRALRWARRHEHRAFGRVAGMVRTAALVELGRGAQAARSAGVLLADFSDGWQAFGFYLPELWLVLCDALAAGGQHARAQALAAQGVQWLQDRASQDVPALYRDSFLQRNPFNSRLLRWPAP